MEEDEEESCPLCMNALDETDHSFFACPCNYQVCLFCVNYIMQQMNGKCPACRKDYQESQFRYDADVARQYREKMLAKKKDKHQKSANAKADPKASEEDLRARHVQQLKDRKAKTGGRKDLAEVRVLQRNVVHVLGLTANLAKADILRRPEFFGQYGKLTRVFVSKAPMQAKVASNGSPPLYSAYLTFEKQDDAQTAIQAVDGFTVDGQVLRASFGTNRYCKRFLEGEKCDRKDCNLLHKLVEENNNTDQKAGGGGGGGGGGAAASRRQEVIALVRLLQGEDAPRMCLEKAEADRLADIPPDASS